MRPTSTNKDKYENNLALAREVCAKQGDFIRAVIESKIKNPAQVDDIFQNFFLSLVHKPLPAGIKNVKSYLYRAISNDIVDAARRNENYKTQIQKYSKQLNYSANNSNLADALSEEEEFDKMFSLIKGRLRKSESKAISLRYGSNYSIEEVAERMGVDRTSVSKYISAGLKKMRKFLTVR